MRTELVKRASRASPNRKADEGSKHPDRNAQFEYINAKVIAAQAQQQPIVSVDTKKKELIGNFKNGGTDYRPKGDPRRVNVHDFEDKKLGKVVPYGVYDVTANAGFVSVGITSDTAEFAVEVDQLLARTHGTTALSECAGADDHGGLRRLERGAALEARTAKAGRPERARDPRPPRTARHIEVEQDRAPDVATHQNWRGRPLTDRLAVVELIGATTTKTGLKVESALDTRSYQKGIKVNKAAMKSLDITGDPFHPEWNYTIRPRRQPPKS